MRENSDESEKSDGSDSERDVIEDEDLQMAAEIEKERRAKQAQKRKEKREAEGKPPPRQRAKKRPAPKRRRLASSDDDEDDDDEDESPKKPTKKARRRAKSSDDDDEEGSSKTSKKPVKKAKKQRSKSSDDDDDVEKSVKKKKDQKKKKVEKRKKQTSSEESEDEDSDSDGDKKKSSKKKKQATPESEDGVETNARRGRGRPPKKPAKPVVSSESESDSDESDDSVMLKKPKKSKSTKKVQKKQRSESEESEESDEEAPRKSRSRSASTKKNNRKSEESDEEEEEKVTTKKSKKTQIEKKSLKKSRSKSVNSDDDDDVEEEKPKKKTSTKRKRSKSSSEEASEASEASEKAPSESEKSGDSDEEEELLITTKSKKKKPIVTNLRSSGESGESDDEIMPKQKKRGAVVMVSGSESEAGEAAEDVVDDDDDGMKSHKSTSSDDNEDSSDGSIVLSRSKKNKKKAPEPEKKKKGIIMDSSKLAKETIDAEKAEKERRKRLEKKQKEFNGIVMEEGDDLTELLTGTSSQRKLKSVVLDPDASSQDPDKSPVEVHKSLVRILKPHQAHGIQFMYDCAFESLDRLETEGSGGILAHCMGLGKTLQVITFLHTILMHEKISEKCKRVLVVVPKNVIINWFKEFQKWLVDNDEDLDTIEVNELDSCKTCDDRRHALMRWHKSKSPSVMIIGYDLFRILTVEDDPKKKKSKAQRKLMKAKEDFRKYLQNPGPDIVVCDEAHKLKNDDSALSKTMVKILTKRRICLTGTPLQNNLMEYHCMVNFVKPGLLGTKTEFANRFVNIINRGRTKDASPLEVSFMKRRCHVLYEHLKKCVDRKDYRVLTEAIPPKQEYVINVRQTERQCALYKAFLDDVVGSQGLSKRLLADYHMCSRIWTHPYQLVIHEQRLERERILKEDAEEEEAFIDDSDDSEESEDSYHSESDSEESVALSSDDDEGGNKKKKSKKSKKHGNKKPKEAPKTRRIRDLDDEDDDEEGEGEDTAMNILQNGIRQSKRLAGEDADIRDTDTPPEYNGWFSKLGLVSEEDRDEFTLSNKLILLMEVIKKCEEIGDKLLVFSQSLESLSLIKRMLEYMAGTGQWFSDGHEALNAEGETWSWLEGEDYMTIDGSVQSVKRDAVQTTFNDPENLRARLMLISTRAGSLGTNMVAANRVIIFDACWNPSHDTQSLFRVYRFGQTKPVYIYRFIAQGTMEERIYKRQVTKESTSMRVVDEAQIQRHYLGHDLTELYQFTPAAYDPDVEISCAPPKDRLLADIIHKNQFAVVDYLEHDTLFANVEEEKLTDQEMKDAWADYEKDKQGVTLPPMRGPALPLGQPGAPGVLLGPNMQSMLQTRYNEALRIDQMQHDILFKELNKMRMKDVGTSVKVVLLRNLLESMLPFIPEEMRGGMSEFNTHFIRLVHETDRKMETPADLLKKALESFRTVIKMVRTIPQCQEPLMRMARTYPYLFNEPT